MKSVGTVNLLQATRGDGFEGLRPPFLLLRPIGRTDPIFDSASDSCIDPVGRLAGAVDPVGGLEGGQPIPVPSLPAPLRLLEQLPGLVVGRRVVATDPLGADNHRINPVGELQGDRLAS